jgi:hypothetical protein
MHRWALLIALLIFGACSHSTQPEGALPLEFRSVPYDEVQAFAAEGQSGSLGVRDRFITGVCHDRETQEAWLRGSTVTLRIAHPRSDGPGACIALGKLGAYVATIGGLAPGTYLVQVEYSGDISTETYPRPAMPQSVGVR